SDDLPASASVPLGRPGLVRHFHGLAPPVRVRKLHACHRLWDRTAVSVHQYLVCHGSHTPIDLNEDTATDYGALNGAPEPMGALKRVALSLLAATATLAYCHAEVTRLRSEVRKALQDTNGVHEVHYTTNLPPVVIKLCTEETGMAEPGQ